MVGIIRGPPRLPVGGQVFGISMGSNCGAGYINGAGELLPIAPPHFSSHSNSISITARTMIRDELWCTLAF